jgi:hypothetical protein
VSPTDQVSNLINCLTNDEDQRQDLWVHYLSGHSPSTFASYLKKVNEEFSVETDIQEHVWHVLNNPPSDKFNALLSYFSEIEQSVVCLLALGLTVSQISQYKGISEVRIRQVIEIVRYNEVWTTLYGINPETTKSKRVVRKK